EISNGDDELADFTGSALCSILNDPAIAATTVSSIITPCRIVQVIRDHEGSVVLEHLTFFKWHEQIDAHGVHRLAIRIAIRILDLKQIARTRNIGRISCRTTNMRQRVTAELPH